MGSRLLALVGIVSVLSMCLADSAAAQFGAAPEKGNPPATESKIDRKVTVNFEETPFRAAIDLIFAGSGLQYAIDPDVENTPIKLRVQDVTIPQVVRLVVRQAAVAQKGLGYQYKDGVYNFYGKRKPDGSAAQALSLLIGKRGSRTELTPGGWLKIELQHVDAANIAELLGGQVIKPTGAGEVRVAKATFDQTGWVVPEGIEGVLAISADNSLVVRGTPEGMRALTDLLSLIDVPQRQTTLVLNAGSLRVESTIGESDEVTLVDADGAERLEVKVSLQRTSGGLYANLDGLVRINGRTRSFKTRRSVLPGVAIPIATVDGGKGKVTLYLKAVGSGPTLGGFGGGGGLDGGRRF